jgi:hypothetical protein
MRLHLQPAPISGCIHPHSWAYDGAMEMRYESRPDHLLVMAAGPFDYEDARRGLKGIIQTCTDPGIHRILIDGRGITTLVSIADRFDLASQLTAESKGVLRMAVVMATDQMFTKTFEDAAVNRAAPLRTTDSMKEAREFLELAPE